MKRYRIIRSRKAPAYLEVQHRPTWWPFWLYAGTANTLESARELAAAHAVNGHVVEDLGTLPADTAATDV